MELKDVFAHIDEIKKSLEEAQEDKVDKLVGDKYNGAPAKGIEKGEESVDDGDMDNDDEVKESAKKSEDPEKSHDDDDDEVEEYHDKAKKSDDDNDDNDDDEVEESCDMNKKSKEEAPEVGKSLAKPKEDAVVKSLLGATNELVGLVKSLVEQNQSLVNVIGKSVKEPEPEKAVEKSVEEPKDEVKKSVEEEPKDEVKKSLDEPKEDNVEKSIKEEPEKDEVKKSIPEGKSVDPASDIAKSVDEDIVKVGELKEVITKSINNYYGKASFRDQNILKNLQDLYHEVGGFKDDDVAPEELVDRYNEI